MGLKSDGGLAGKEGGGVDGWTEHIPFILSSRRFLLTGSLIALLLDYIYSVTRDQRLGRGTAVP